MARLQRLEQLNSDCCVTWTSLAVSVGLSGSEWPPGRSQLFLRKVPAFSSPGPLGSAVSLAPHL